MQAFGCPHVRDMHMLAAALSIFYGRKVDVLIPDPYISCRHPVIGT